LNINENAIDTIKKKLREMTTPPMWRGDVEAIKKAGDRILKDRIFGKKFDTNEYYNCSDQSALNPTYMRKAKAEYLRIKNDKTYDAEYTQRKKYKYQDALSMEKTDPDAFAKSDGEYMYREGCTEQQIDEMIKYAEEWQKKAVAKLNERKNESWEADMDNDEILDELAGYSKNGGFKPLQDRLMKKVENAKSLERLEYLRKDADMGLRQLQQLIKNMKIVQNGETSRYLNNISIRTIERDFKNGNSPELVQKHIDFLKNTYKPAIVNKKKELIVNGVKPLDPDSVAGKARSAAKSYVKWNANVVGKVVDAKMKAERSIKKKFAKNESSGYAPEAVEAIDESAVESIKALLSKLGAIPKNIWGKVKSKISDLFDHAGGKSSGGVNEVAVGVFTRSSVTGRTADDYMRGVEIAYAVTYRNVAMYNNVATEVLKSLKTIRSDESFEKACGEYSRNSKPVYDKHAKRIEDDAKRFKIEANKNGTRPSHLEYAMNLMSAKAEKDLIKNHPEYYDKLSKGYKEWYDKITTDLVQTFASYNENSLIRKEYDRVSKILSDEARVGLAQTFGRELGSIVNDFEFTKNDIAAIGYRVEQTLNKMKPKNEGCEVGMNKPMEFAPEFINEVFVDKVKTAWKNYSTPALYRGDIDEVIKGDKHLLERCLSVDACKVQLNRCKRVLSEIKKTKATYKKLKNDKEYMAEYGDKKKHKYKYSLDDPSEFDAEACLFGGCAEQDLDKYIKFLETEYPKLYKEKTKRFNETAEIIDEGGILNKLFDKLGDSLDKSTPLINGDVDAIKKEGEGLLKKIRNTKDIDGYQKMYLMPGHMKRVLSEFKKIAKDPKYDKEYKDAKRRKYAITAQNSFDLSMLSKSDAEEAYLHGCTEQQLKDILAYAEDWEKRAKAKASCSKNESVMTESVAPRNIFYRMTESEMFMTANRMAKINGQEVVDILPRVAVEGQGFAHVGMNDLDSTVVYELFESNRFKLSCKQQMKKLLAGGNVVLVYGDEYRIPTCIPFVIQSKGGNNATVFVNITPFTSINKNGKIVVTQIRNYSGLMAVIFAGCVAYETIRGGGSLPADLADALVLFYAGMMTKVINGLVHADSIQKETCKYLCAEFALVQMYGTEKGTTIFQRFKNKYFPKLGNLVVNSIDDTFHIDSFDNMTLFVEELKKNYPIMKGLSVPAISERWMRSFGSATALSLDYLGFHLYTLCMLLFESPLVSRMALEPLIDQRLGSNAFKRMQIMIEG